MKKSVFFVASCSACSKKNQLEISELGRQVNCVFCGKKFIAHGADSSSAALDDPVHYWIRFTDHDLLEPDFLPDGSKEICRTPR